jgi:hypothetical protein
MRLPSKGIGGLPGGGRVHARVFHHLLHAGVARGLVRPLDPRKGHRFLGRGLDRAAEVGDLAVGDVVAPASITRIAPSSMNSGSKWRACSMNFCLLAVGTAITKPSMYDMS